MTDKLSQQKVLRETVETLSTPENMRHVCRSVPLDEPLPSQEAVEEIISLCRAVIFPGFYGDASFNCNNLPYSLGLNVERIQRLLTSQISAGLAMVPGLHNTRAEIHSRARETALSFIASLPELRKWLSEDVDAIYLGDPAAVSVGEIIYSYPAIRAITNYRVAHRLYELGVPVIPRMIGEHAHRETGIDIHPAARIGHAFMIDHGTGVVIGETAIIGNNVKIYQGVTLGARSFPTDENDNPVKGLPRHPIIGDDVVIYANSTILGRITIGSGSTIGGNIWITEDIAPGSVVLQARANHTIRQKKESK